MDDFARVKAAVDIVAVVGQTVALRKQGARLVGLCPFHAEKTPSFGVVPDGQYFKCFGCGKGGDVFVFLQELYHIEPVEALRRLAEEAGIELSGGPGARERSRARGVKDALEAAQRCFREALKGSVGREVVAFLASRGVREEAIGRFGLGYAVSNGRLLVTTLRKAGFDESLLEEAGLAWRRGTDLGDVFRERITIPIRDERGVAIAFGARRRQDGPGAPEPKYLNSRENPLFHKSRVLYGLDLARESIHKERRVVLVEGYMDVILAHQAGVTTTVAALGTSVTADHAARLARMADEVILCLDSDDAGRRASVRAVPLLLGAGLRIRVVDLPGVKDPGDYFGAGASRQDFERLVAERSVAGLDFLLRALGLGTARNQEERVGVARRLIEALKDVRDVVVREAALRHAARELDLPESGLLRQRKPPGAEEAESDSSVSAPKAKTARDLAEEDLLIALLRKPELRELARELLDPEVVSDPLRARLFRELVAGGEVGDILERTAGEKEAQQTLLDLVERPLHADPGRLFDGAVRYFQRERKSEERRLLQRQFEGPLRNGDVQAQMAYLSAYQAWRKQGGG